MTMNAAVISQDTYIENKLARRNAFYESLEQGQRPAPKSAEQIHSIDDILGDLEFSLTAFPSAAIKAAIEHKSEITPFLLQAIKDAIDAADDLDGESYGHMHALFLLSEFREKKAFPLIIDMASLSEDAIEELLGDMVSEDLPRFLASTYDGNLSLLKTLIEDEKAYTWCRDAGLRCLTLFIKEKMIERDEVVEYLRTLFENPSFKNDCDMMANLVDVACDIYPEELQTEIRAAFEQDLVESMFINLDDVDDILAKDKNDHLDATIYKNDLLYLITDAHEEMSGWAFHDENAEDADAISYLHTMLATHLIAIFINEAETHGLKERKSSDEDPSGSDAFNFVRDLIKESFDDEVAPRTDEQEAEKISEIKTFLENQVEKNPVLKIDMDAIDWTNVSLNHLLIDLQIEFTNFQNSELDEVDENESDHHVHHAGCSHGVQPIVRQEPKVGRNEPCVCGSGKKFKKCCGA